MLAQFMYTLTHTHAHTTYSLSPHLLPQTAPGAAKLPSQAEQGVGVVWEQVGRAYSPQATSGRKVVYLVLLVSGSGLASSPGSPSSAQ